MTTTSALASSELVFPDVELVHHIPWPDHPLGRYVRKRRRVELSRKELAGRGKEDRRFAVYHELGHWWRTERVPDRLMRGDSDEEDFANMFAEMFLGNGDAFSHDIALEEQTQIYTFAEEVLARLDEELAA